MSFVNHLILSSGYFHLRYLCRPLLIALFVFISSQPVHHHLPLNPDPGNLWRPHMLWHACHSTRKCQEIEGDRRGTVQALFGTLSSWQLTLPIRRTTAHERTTADGDDCHRGGWIVFTRLTRCCQFWSFPRRGQNWHEVREKLPGWLFGSRFWQFNSIYPDWLTAWNFWDRLNVFAKSPCLSRCVAVYGMFQTMLFTWHSWLRRTM